MAQTEGASTTTIARVLLWIAIIGALNWGLVGFFNWDLVRAIFGGETRTAASAFSRVIYAIVGLAGLGLLYFAPRLRAISEPGIARRAEVRP
jgi:uncharacterized membrane protein YuzA (DUF378 family)